MQLCYQIECDINSKVQLQCVRSSNIIKFYFKTEADQSETKDVTQSSNLFFIC